MDNISKAIKEFIDSEGVFEIPDLALVNLYYGMRAVLNRLDNEVSELSFEVKYPDEGERKDIFTQLHAVDDFCAALRRQIKFHQRKREVMDKMMFQTQHDPNFDDVDPEQKAQAMASHHCGQDAEEQRHNYRAMVEGQGIHIHDGNVPLDQCGCIKICKVGGGNATVQDPNESQPADAAPESLKELVGMQVQLVFPAGHKCDGCDNYTSCDRNWKKLELIGGYYLCLAPLPNSIVTE
jgi:hypothetical protein